MPRSVELYYDFSSPNAYFGAMQLPAIAQKTGATIVYRPFLLGGVFKALGTPPAPGMSNPAKAAHNMRDLERWSKKYGHEVSFPSRFPLNTVKPLRIALSLSGHEKERDFVEAVFTAYWTKDKDISDETVLGAILDGIGLDGQELVGRASDPVVKEQLKQVTAAAAERGVFGTPVFFVGEELFWGKDRLDFVEDALAAQS